MSAEPAALTRRVGGTSTSHEANSRILAEQGTPYFVLDDFSVSCAQVGDPRPTAETLGDAGLASVSGYTKISDRRRREAYDRLEDTGL